MNASSWTEGPPKTILLATDLSARSDRALDRALALAAQWKARLIVLHVLEEADSGLPDPGRPLPSWRRPPDPLAAAKRRLLADLGAAAKDLTVMIEEGDPADAIARVAERTGCDLIVAGTARDELLGRFSFGGVLDRLLRSSRVPVLVVKRRVRGPYRKIVVASDLSDSSRHALDAAAHLFPKEKISFFHAYETVLAGRMVDMDTYQQGYRKSVERDVERFLEEASTPAGWKRPNILIEQGVPSTLLRDYAQEKEVDLVVLGTHGRSAVFEIFLGSVAKQIMEDAPCDALVIREPRAATQT